MTYGDLVAEELDLGAPTLVSVDVEDYYHEVPGGEEVFLRNFYDDRDIARVADEVGGRVVSTVKTGIAPLMVDGIARIELAS